MECETVYKGLLKKSLGRRHPEPVEGSPQADERSAAIYLLL
jgi:hypothetical protein